jgi:hypothetical protein
MNSTKNGHLSRRLDAGKNARRYDAGSLLETHEVFKKLAVPSMRAVPELPIPPKLDEQHVPICHLQWRQGEGRFLLPS